MNEQTKAELIRKDSFPEGIEYSDDGCSLAPKCVECPFAQCQKESLSTLERTERYKLIYECHLDGSSRQEIADAFGVSLRTISRVISLKGIYPSDENPAPPTEGRWTPTSSFKAPKPWDEIRPGFSKPNRTIYASG